MGTADSPAAAGLRARHLLFTVLYSSRLTAVTVFGIIGLLLELSNIKFLVNHLWNGLNLGSKLLFYLVQCKPAHNTA